MPRVLLADMGVDWRAIKIVAAEGGKPFVVRAVIHLLKH